MEARILQAVKMTLAAVIKDTATPHGMRHPLSDSTIEDLRQCLALISARLRQNDIPGALKAIDVLEQELPDQPLANNLRGRVLLLKRDLPGATAQFEAALAKDPKYFPAVASLAAMDLSAGNPEAARKRFDNHGPGLMGGLVIAVLLHGTYDGALFLIAVVATDLPLLILPLLMVPFLVVVLGYRRLRTHAKEALRH